MFPHETNNRTKHTEHWRVIHLVQRSRGPSCLSAGAIFAESNSRINVYGASTFRSNTGDYAGKRTFLASGIFLCSSITIITLLASEPLSIVSHL